MRIIIQPHKGKYLAYRLLKNFGKVFETKQEAFEYGTNIAIKERIELRFIKEGEIITKIVSDPFPPFHNH